ncbi:MAG: oligosaccharide flippase family protein [Candidatus Hydrogenedentota bacterium]
MEDTVRKRYFFKLLTNFTALLLGILSVTIIPRALGVALYGDYNFLLTSLLAILVFLDFNTSTAFYTYSARDTKADIKEFTFIIVFLLVFFIFITGIVLLVSVDFYKYIFPGQKPDNIILMTILVTTIIIVRVISGYSDAKALTVTTEKINVIVRIITFIIILILFLSLNLNLQTYVLTQIISFFVIASCAVCCINRKILIKNIIKFNNIDFRFFVDYWYRFSGPLFIYNIFGFIIAFFDRWILQFASGSREQGYYSFAFQIGTVINTLVVSFTPIFRREVVKYNYINDVGNIKRLFVKYTYFFFTLSTFLSLIMFFLARQILKLAGSDFKDALLPFLIICFYPMYQVYGHMCGEMFIATERTKIYTKLGMFTNTIGLLAAYFILAPKKLLIPGLELGAIGLALKMVLVNIFHIHILLYFCCLIFNLNFFDFIIHQLKVLSLFFIIGCLSYYISYNTFINNDILNIITFIFLFSLIIITLVLKKSTIVGITIDKEFVYSFINKIF